MYFDSSALVKLLIDEPGDRIARDAWRIAPMMFVSTVAVPEVASAIRRAIAGSRIRRSAAARAWVRFEAALGQAIVVNPVEQIAVQAAGYASLHSLRGFDALHLASARISSDAIVTFDRSLAAAASAEGLTVIGT